MVYGLPATLSPAVRPQLAAPVTRAVVAFWPLTKPLRVQAKAGSMSWLCAAWVPGGQVMVYWLPATLSPAVRPQLAAPVTRAVLSFLPLTKPLSIHLPYTTLFRSVLELAPALTKRCARLMVKPA